VVDFEAGVSVDPINGGAIEGFDSTISPAKWQPVSEDLSMFLVRSYVNNLNTSHSLYREIAFIENDITETACKRELSAKDTQTQVNSEVAHLLLVVFDFPLNTEGIRWCTLSKDAVRVWRYFNMVERSRLHEDWARLDCGRRKNWGSARRTARALVQL
jgi:hypothetical protein